MLAFEHDELLTESEVFQQQAAEGAKATKQGAQKCRLSHCNWYKNSGWSLQPPPREPERRR